MPDRLANYEPVQARIGRFWADHPTGRVACELLEHDDQHALAFAQVWRDITDEHPAATGYAAEVRDSSPVNRQGWMIENAETSAIGRALANLGYAGCSGGTRPSAEDMHRADDRTVDERRRDLADKARAKATFDRLKMLAGSDAASSVRQLATNEGRKLTLTELGAYPAWRQQVDDLLAALIAQEDDDGPPPNVDPETGEILS